MISALALGLALTGGSASAGVPGPSESLGKAKGIEYMRGTYLAVASQTSQSVKCPGDRLTMSGGGAMGGPGTTSRLNESYPASDGSGWIAEGSTDGVDARTLVGYAICTTKPVSIAAEGPVEFAGTSSFAATCPDGWRATGGGFASPGIGLEMLASARAPYPPKGRVWRVGALNDTGVAAEGTGYASCAAGYEVRIRRSKAVPVRASSTGVATARCRASEAVGGGGWTATAKNGEPLLSSLATKPIDSGDRRAVPDDGWKVRVRNSAKRAKVVAQAVCVKPTPL